MRPTPADRNDEHEELDLDLPPLDGVEHEDAEPGEEGDEDIDDSPIADAFDDATGEADPVEWAAEGAEGGWLEEADDAATLDVGTFDLLAEAETRGAGEDEPDLRAATWDDVGGLLDEGETVDGGEEGPLGSDEELREEDLPALDADDEDEAPPSAGFDGETVLLADVEELRWDDRAWSRIDWRAEDAEGDDESGLLAIAHDSDSARDATWRRLDETGRLTAATHVPGGSVVVALDERSRAVLVRILPDGVARIIAEIDTGNGEDDDHARVARLVWLGGEGALVAIGNFGAQAFRPA